MTRIFLLGVVCITVHLLAIAQKSPIKWGKIPTEDLAMTSYEADTLAGAVVLCDFGEVTFDIGLEGPIYRYNRQKRIKILNQSGFDEGNVSIPYFGKKGSMDLKAHIFQADGTVTEVSKKEMFDERIVEDYYRISFAFPNLAAGAVLEYEYSYSSPYLSKLPTWYFQEDIPIRWSELRITMLEWFKYARLLQGQERLAVLEDYKENLNIRGTVVVGDKSRYVAENMPALRQEPYITTMNDYRSRIRFQLKALEIPGSVFETYMTNWESLAKGLMESDFFGAQIKKANKVKEVLERISEPLASAKNQTEKANIIYAHLLSNMEWDGSFDYTCNVGLDKSYEARKANSAELNLMFLAMLKAQEIESYPILISTRGHGLTFPAYPFMDQFNHVLVYAVLDEKPILIDLFDKLSPMGLLREESLNKYGLVIMEDFATEWIEINSTTSKDILLANLELTSSGTIQGEVKVQSSGYSAVSERHAVQEDSDGKFWANRFETYSSTAAVSECLYSNTALVQEPLKGNFKVSLPEAAQVVDDFIYFSPVIYSSFDQNPFKLEKRTFPVEIPYPIHEDLILNIKLPEGYVLESKPESVNINLPNNGSKFTYMLNLVNPTQLQVITKFKVDQLFFTPEEYDVIKNFFNLVAEKLSEQLVLKKV